MAAAIITISVRNPICLPPPADIFTAAPTGRLDLGFVCIENRLVIYNIKTEEAGGLFLRFPRFAYGFGSFLYDREFSVAQRIENGIYLSAQGRFLCPSV